MRVAVPFCQFVVAAEGWFAQWVTCGKLGTFMERDELTIPPNDLALISELDTVLEAFLLSACALGQVSDGLGMVSLLGRALMTSGSFCSSLLQAFVRLLDAVAVLDVS